MNKTIGLGIGIAAVAIVVAFVYSYSIPESETQEENLVIEEKATSNVQTDVSTSGNKISIKAEDKLGLEDRP